MTILRLAQQKPELKIVADQFGAPTAAADLAEVTARIVSELMLAAAITGSYQDALGDDAGVYHATSQGETTWYGFASEFPSAAGACASRRPARHPDPDSYV